MHTEFTSDQRELFLQCDSTTRHNSRSFIGQRSQVRIYAMRDEADIIVSSLKLFELEIVFLRVTHIDNQEGFSIRPKIRNLSERRSPNN